MLGARHTVQDQLILDYSRAACFMTIRQDMFLFYCFAIRRKIVIELMQKTSCVGSCRVM